MEHIDRTPWDDDDFFESVMAHRRLHLATVLAAAHAHDEAAELERELAELDRDLAAGVGSLDAERRNALQERYAAWLAGAAGGGPLHVG